MDSRGWQPTRPPGNTTQLRLVCFNIFIRIIPFQQLGEKIAYKSVPVFGNTCSSYKIISLSIRSIYKTIFCDSPWVLSMESYLASVQVVFLESHWWDGWCELVAMVRYGARHLKNLNEDWNGMNEWRLCQIIIVTIGYRKSSVCIIEQKKSRKGSLGC